MVNAIVLLTVAKDRIHAIAESFSEMTDITEVYSLAGEYDLAVIIRHKSAEGMEAVITDHLLKTDGIVDSETLMAFRVYSRYDLERMFDMA
jgi:DNA-binding Lrp family transcriptional regulator